jgi:hypothetical protein
MSARLPVHRFLVAFTAALLVVAGKSGEVLAQDLPVIQSDAFAAEHPSFDDYWYQGLAELSHYSLEQSRYGEVHPGEAVLIYVTEDFLDDIQVKWDHGDREHAVSVLKLNAYRYFYTGIYPYTVMTSIFTPVLDATASALKISFSAIEWCGSTYGQLNRGEEEYRYTQHSYFQSEADRIETLPLTATEDGLWTLLRRDPSQLPTGALTLLPSMTFQRLMHQPPGGQDAEATLEDVAASPYAEAPARLYTVTYPALQRTVRIWFEPAFPYRVLAWEEQQPELFSRTGGEPPVLTTRAVLTQSIMLDYWQHNALGDAPWRAVLGLDD